MAETPFESGDEERVWDEYDWERFLQQQDHKTEKYMELLERYLDNPNRDQIIAREMGWNQLRDENGRDWSENLDALFQPQFRNQNPAASQPFDADADEEDLNAAADEDSEEDDAAADDLDEETAEEDELEARENYNVHPLYQAASALTMRIDGLFDDQAPISQHPAAVRLTTSSTLASVKLAAALCDDEEDEIGMTIAYLKRALKAITTALEAAGQCGQEQLMTQEEANEIRARIFQVRDGIINLMGESRTEWRRRHGQGH